MTTFEKNYDFTKDEKIYVDWERKGYFKENTEAPNGKFMISFPPPNVTGVLHIGHAETVAIQDIMVRYNRMIGKKTLWIPGTDHASISTQVVVEKKLSKDGLPTREQLGRVKFLEQVWKFVEYSRFNIIKQSKKLGASMDWSQEQFTLSERNYRAVRQVFKQLYKKGKIYKDNYITNWCPRCQTVLSDLEVLMKEKKGKLVHIKYFVSGKGISITVATTRPETIFADVAIAVNPSDKRYKKLIGKTVQIPIINKEIPIIGDYDVDINFGTGALKITPTHDKADFEIAKRHNLPMDIYAIGKDGKLTSSCANFEGLQAEESVESIIEHLHDIGNLEKVEEYDNNNPRCERCDTLIQPLISQQWFMDIEQTGKKCMEKIYDGGISVTPKKFEKTFDQWFSNLQPWCISRQLRWGHRIPVWYCENGHKNVFDENNILEQYQKNNKENTNVWLDMIIFNLIADDKLEKDFNIETLIEILYKDSFVKVQGKIYESYIKSYELKSKEIGKFENEIKKLKTILDSVKSQDVELILQAGNDLAEYLMNSIFLKPNDDIYSFELKCEHCESKELKQEEDTLDTWFSSGLWPFTVLGWPEKTDMLQDYYPNNVLETGYDIIFFWVAKMIIMGYEVMQDVPEWKPFEKVYLHGLVRDDKGKKMSKSKGNVIDPLDKIESHGSDVLRLSLVLGTTPGNDVNFSEEKLDYNKRFLNKLWNASRFVYKKAELDETETIDYNELFNLIKDNKSHLTSFDKRILSGLDELVGQVKDSIETFYFGEAFVNVQKFVWNKFCDWYIEISKYDDGPFTASVLIYSLGTIYKLLHPITPFITETLWHKIKFDGDLMVSNFSQQIGIEKDETIDSLVDIIIGLRTIRSINNVKPHLATDVYIENFENSKIKKYEDIIKRIVNINTFLENDKKNNIIVEVIGNIKIGVVIPEQELDYHEKVKELEKQLEAEQQFLQSIRKLLSSDGFRQKASEQIIKQKEDKKEEIEGKILKIKEEISKMKLKIK